MNDQLFTLTELPQICESCGTVAECRPFGLNHEEICVKCCAKDESLTLIRAKEFLGAF